VALDVLVQSDGKIVAGGSFETSDDNNDFALVRYNRDGTVDATFGQSGRVLSDLRDGTDDVITSMALQPGGKIIAVGQTGQYPAFDFALARCTTAGQLDTTFGTGGIVSTDFAQGSFDIGYGVVLAPDGKIVVAGETNAGSLQDFDFAIARYQGL
jgi:uncharacterized delta-60 repeat protein